MQHEVREPREGGRQERRPPGRALVQHAAERPEVARAAVHAARPKELGRHVRRCGLRAGKGFQNMQWKGLSIYAVYSGASCYTHMHRSPP